MNRIERALRALALAVPVAFALAGCSSFGGAQHAYTCPAATTVQDIQTIMKFGPGDNVNDILTAGRITGIQANCGAEKGGIKDNLSIHFMALRSTLAVTHVDLPYFVAIADSNGKILGKQEFSLGLNFPPGSRSVGSMENVTAHLPLKNAELGNVYTIIVGFQLTKKELDFNRTHSQ